MEPLQHLLLILAAWLVSQFFAKRSGVHILTLFGIAAAFAYAPVAALFILATCAEGALMVAYYKNLKRSSNWRKYGPYLLLVNLLFVDFHVWLLSMPVATLAISFSTIRIFMTAKQLLSSRKKMPNSDLYWLLPAGFFLPAMIIGPVFSGTDLRDQHAAGATVNDGLKDYRRLLQGFGLAVLLSPAFGKAVELLERANVDHVVLIASVLFLQLFAAFWGQSLIAEHSSRFFGYRLPQNFRHPWKAKTFKDFWARWHRSMAQFVLQYIFLPLNLKGVPPKLATTLAFMFMGVWHNLSIGYLVWGICHGLLLANSTEESERLTVRILQQALLWIVVIGLSWIANYGPLS